MPIELHGADVLMRQLKEYQVLQPKLDKLTTRYAGLLETAIKGAASGRPGPNAPTGDYRRSWTTAFGTLPNGNRVAVVGTLKPQGMRLEYGFNDTDALGREYHQPPYPHVRPSYLRVLPLFHAACRRAAEPRKK